MIDVVLGGRGKEGSCHFQNPFSLEGGKRIQLIGIRVIQRRCRVLEIPM